MTPSFGTLSSEWLARFPKEEVGKIVAYVAEGWNDLCATFPDAHHAEESEPDLTKSLSEHLDDPIRRRSSGIGGRFSSERPVNKRVALGKLKQLGRTDIEYHFPAPGRATLTLEFKKLDGSPNLRSKYKRNGLVKFINGPYSTQETTGIMIGLTTCDISEEEGKIAKNIQKSKSILSLKDNGAGLLVVKPPAFYGADVSFETHHDRPPTVSPDPILVGHVFFPLPLRP